jgi:hypothetical protein
LEKLPSNRGLARAGVTADTLGEGRVGVVPLSSNSWLYSFHHDIHFLEQSRSTHHGPPVNSWYQPTIPFNFLGNWVHLECHIIRMTINSWYRIGMSFAAAHCSEQQHSNGGECTQYGQLCSCMSIVIRCLSCLNLKLLLPAPQRFLKGGPLCEPLDPCFKA